MNRRRFVCLAGAAVGGVAAAGCSGDPDDGSSNPDDGSGDAGDTPERTAAEPLPAGVSITDQVVEPGVVRLSTPDSIGVYADAGQYLLVRVALAGDAAPDPGEFALAFDGQTYSPAAFTQPLYRDGDLGVGYTGRDPGGWLAFGLPETGDASNVSLSVDGGTWTPAERVRDRLAAPLPPFDVEFSAPDRVEPGVAPELTLSVTNTGEEPGTAVLALNRVGPRIAYAPDRDVHWNLEPGETATDTWEGHAPIEERGVTYHLRGADVDRRSRTIEPATEDAGASN